MAKKTDSKNQNQPDRPTGTEPWLSRNTGLIIMILGSLALVVYIAWTLSPPMALWEAILWGLGFGLAMWGVFAVAITFNKWVRRR